MRIYREAKALNYPGQTVREATDSAEARILPFPQGSSLLKKEELLEK